MGFQDAVVVVLVLVAGAFLWRRFRPRRRRTVAFIPLNQLRVRPKSAQRRGP
jgi:hypothetical protein